MKRALSLLALAALSACAGSSTVTQTRTVRLASNTQSPTVVATDSGGDRVVVVNGSADGWLQGSPVQTRLLRGSDGNTYVGLWVDTPAAQGVARRAPLDVVLVIDTSGSMSGDKIQNARMAAASFIESLTEGDIVSLYAFSDAVTELAPPTTVNSATRAAMLQRVQGLFAAGGTNLHDGLMAARMAAEQAPATHPVRRVVMISDGRATVGRTSAEDIANVAAGATENGTQVTAIGVGLDYDENTLGRMAVRSAGRLYHLEMPQQMSTILHSELDLLGQTVAANAYIEITPEDGVVLEGTEAVRLDHQGATLRIPLGSLYSQQHREVLLRARIPTTSLGARSLGTARLVYEDPGAPGAARNTSNLALNCEVTDSAESSSQSANQRVQGMVLSFEAAQSQMRAVQLLNQGQAEQAEAELGRTEERLRQAASVQFSDEHVQTALRSQAAQVSSGRAAARRAVAAPAPARATMSRAAALHNNSQAMDAFGF